MAMQIAGGSTGSTSTVKKCMGCGKNVAGGKRMKDSQGRYWCIECGTADLRKRGVTSPNLGKPSKSASSGPGLMTRLRDLIPAKGDGGTSKGRLIGMIAVMAVLAIFAYLNMKK